MNPNILFTWNRVENFVMYETDVSLHGTTYDYESITHYPPTAFSKNGSATIVSKEPGGETAMGQRDHLSPGDVKRLNIMYSCAWKFLNFHDS